MQNKIQLKISGWRSENTTNWNWEIVVFFIRKETSKKGFEQKLIVRLSLNPIIIVRLNGSYEALQAGNIADALVDFTGGVCESTNLQETGFSEDEDGRLAYFKTMQKAMGERSLIGASISVSQDDYSYHTAMHVIWRFRISSWSRAYAKKKWVNLRCLSKDIYSNLQFTTLTERKKAEVNVSGSFSVDHIALTTATDLENVPYTFLCCSTLGQWVWIHLRELGIHLSKVCVID